MAKTKLAATDKGKGGHSEGPKRKSKQNTTTDTNPQKKAKPNPKKPTSKDAPPQKVKNPRAASLPPNMNQPL